MRLYVNPRASAGMILRKVLAILPDRAAQPGPPTQPARITYLLKDGVRRGPGRQ